MTGKGDEEEEANGGKEWREGGKRRQVWLKTKGGRLNMTQPFPSINKEGV